MYAQIKSQINHTRLQKVKKLLIVVGTRPNYIKITQFKVTAEKHFPGVFEIKIVHTGQHFDKAMADVFFEQLNIWPDFFLNISPSSPNTQIASIMANLEKVLMEYNPDWVIVPGDVNSTIAAAICVNKCGYKLAHLESGLRSFDRSMPEEINRIITDQVSDLYFVTEQSGLDNLSNEGKENERVFHVGNTMIDTLFAFDLKIRNNSKLNDLNLDKNQYAVVTIHRPATVDNYQGLKMLCDLLKRISETITIVFPMHPRTKKNLLENNLEQEIIGCKNIILIEPLDYFSFQNLLMYSKFVLTDSGGIQEETTFRKVPCLTLRPNTERPVTVSEGTNMLISFSIPEIIMNVEKIISNNIKQSTIPQFWDGKATQRILEVLEKY